MRAPRAYWRRQFSRRDPLTLSLDAEPRDIVRIFAACTDGPCQRGLRICPSPQECQAPEGGIEGPRSFRPMAVALILFWACVGLVLWRYFS